MEKNWLKFFSQDNNWHVFAGYRNKDLITSQDNVEYFYMDMTNRKSIADAAELIKSKVDKIDVLINVAGCVVAGPIEKIDTDKLREQFDVNTFSHLEFVQNLVEPLSNGKIINVSSMASFGHFPFISPYCASKELWIFSLMHLLLKIITILKLFQLNLVLLQRLSGRNLSIQMKNY